jgi:hypothetical protein
MSLFECNKRLEYLVQLKFLSIISASVKCYQMDNHMGLMQGADKLILSHEPRSSIPFASCHTPSSSFTLNHASSTHATGPARSVRGDKPTPGTSLYICAFAPSDLISVKTSAERRRFPVRQGRAEDHNLSDRVVRRYVELHKHVDRGYDSSFVLVHKGILTNG